MTKQTATLELAAVLAGGTKAAFKSMADGFKEVAKGMRTSAKAFADLGTKSGKDAAAGLNKAAAAIDKSTKEMLKSTKGADAAKKGFDNLNKSVKETEKAEAILSSTIKDNSEKLNTNAKNSRTAKKEAESLGKGTKNLGSDLKVVSEALAKANTNTKLTATEFLYAERASKKLGSDVVNLSQAMTYAGLKGEKWARSLSLSTIEEARASGAISKHAMGLGKLTAESLKALGLNKKQIAAMTEIIAKQDAYTAALKKAESISDIGKRKERIALIKQLGIAYGKANDSFKTFAGPVKNIDSVLAKLTQTVKANGLTSEVSVKSLDKYKIVSKTLSGAIQIAGNNIKIFNRDGLKAMGDMSVESASKLGLLSTGFRKLVDAEKRLAEATGRNLASIQKESDAQRKRGASVEQVITSLKNLENKQKALNKEDKARLTLISRNEAKLKELSTTYGKLLDSTGKYGDQARKLLGTFSTTSTKIGLLSSKLRVLVKDWQDNERAAQKQTQQLGLLKRTYDPLIASSDKYGVATRNLINQFEKGKRTYESTTNALFRLKKMKTEAIHTTNVFKLAIDRLAKSFKTYLSYQVVSSVIMGVRNSMSQGLATIIDYNQSLHDLKAITQATDAEVEIMGETIKKVATTTKFSTNEVAEGMKTLGQAGFTAEESIAAMEGVANLATGTLSEMKTVVDLVTSSIRVFQMDASETSHVADVFANAVNGSKLTIDKLRIAMNYIGPVAKLAGASFEDVTSTMMLLANQGIRASTIGTGLRQVFSKILKPTQDFKDELKKTGLTMADLDPKTNKMSVVIGNLGKVVTDADVAFKLFGMRGAAAVAALANSSAVGFNNMREMVDRSGMASRMAEEQIKGLGVSIKNLKDTVGVLQIEMGETGLTGMLAVLVDMAKWLLDGIIALIKSGFGELVLVVGLATAAVFALTTALTALKSKMVVSWVLSYAKAIGGMALATSGAAVTTTTLTGAIKLLTIAMLTNPITWVIAGLTAAAAAIFYLTNKHKNHMKAIREERAEYEQEQNTLTSYIEQLNKIDEAKDKVAIGSVKHNELERKHRDLLKEIIDKYPHLSSELLSNVGDIGLQTKALKDRNAELEKGIKVGVEEEIAANVKKIRKLRAQLDVRRMDDDIVRPISDETIFKIENQIKDLSAFTAAMAIDYDIRIDPVKAGKDIEAAHGILRAKQEELNKRQILGPWAGLSEEGAIINQDIDAQVAKIRELGGSITESFDKKAVEDYAAAMRIGLSNVEAVIAKTFDTHEEKVVALNEAYNVYNHIQKQFGRAESVIKFNKSTKAVADYEEKVALLNEQLVKSRAAEDETSIILTLNAIEKAGEQLDIKLKKIATGEYDVKDMLDTMTKDIESGAADLQLAIAKLYIEAGKQVRTGEIKSPVQAMVKADLAALDLEKEKLQADLKIIEDTMLKARGGAELPTEDIAMSEAYKEMETARIEAITAINEFDRTSTKKTFSAHRKLIRDRMKTTLAALKEEENANKKANAEIAVEVAKDQKSQQTADEEIRANTESYLRHKLEALRTERKEYESIEGSANAINVIDASILDTEVALSGLAAARALSAKDIADAYRDIAVSQAEFAAAEETLAAGRLERPVERLEAEIVARNKLNAIKQKELEFDLASEQAIPDNDIEIQRSAQALADFKLGLRTQEWEDQKSRAQEQLNLLDDYVEYNKLSSEEINQIWEEAYQARLITEHEKLTEQAYNSDNVMEALRLKSQEFASQTKSMAETIAEQWGELPSKFADGFITAFEDTANGTKSISEAFSDMAESILKDIARVILRQAVMNIALGAMGGFGAAEGGAIFAAAGGPIQNFDTGGKVKGYSPTPTADNIKANLTAGEFVQPVRAVKHFGMDFMESIRTLRFPKLSLAGLGFNFANGGGVPAVNTRNYADGGGVSPFEAPADDRMYPSLNVNVTVPPEQSARYNKTATQIGNKIGKQIQASIRRNG